MAPTSIPSSSPGKTAVAEAGYTNVKRRETGMEAPTFQQLPHRRRVRWPTFQLHKELQEELRWWGACCAESTRMVSDKKTPLRKIMSHFPRGIRFIKQELGPAAKKEKP